MSATASRDYAPWEIGAAFFIAACIQLGAGVTLYFTKMNSVGAVAEVDKGNQLPVKVQPVLDLDGPLLKLGGKKPVLPDMWQSPPKPSPAKAPDEAFVSPKADDQKTPEKEDRKMADAGTEPPPPDAATTDEPVDAAKTDQTTDANPLETSDKPPGTNTEGSDQGIKDGTALEANASNIYHTRVAAFLNRQVQVSCSGDTKSASVTVSLSGTSVTSASAGSTGDADFDGKVKAAAGGLVGQSIPPPPDQYPQFLKPSFTFTVRCH